MKSQSSLEFLLILSVISVLGLSVLVFYGKGIVLDKEALNGVQAPPITGNSDNLTPASDPQIAIYIPLNSSLLSESNFEIEIYGCDEGTAAISLSSNTVVFSYSNVSAQVRNISIIGGEFEPVAEGLSSIKVDYSITCQNRSISSSRSFDTYAAGAVEQGSQIFAQIHRNSESLGYGNSSTQVMELSESDHCTITDIWTGAIYTVGGQCGTANAWDYIIFDGSCGVPPYWSYSRAYCIVPATTGYSISIDNQDDYTPIYNISLRIYTDVGILEANLSDKSPEARITLDGLAVGNATVISVDSDPSEQIPILSNQSGYWAAEQEAYGAYIQADNNLYSTLSFYNSTGVSGPTQSSIQEAVAAFDSSSSKLLGSAAGSEGISCASEDGSLDCPSSYPFSYVINANIYDQLGLQNTTLSYQGSEIILSEG